MTQQQSPHKFLHPRNWKPAKGYANGVVAEGRTIFLAGQIGWNAEQKFESRDFVAQTRQALRNIVAIVQEAGGQAGAHHAADLVCHRQERISVDDWARLGEAYRSVMGKHFPAMTMVQVAALIEDDAKVEIEASAVVPK